MAKMLMPGVVTLLVAGFLFAAPVWSQEPAAAGSPPIAQQLVREGDLALQLQSALKLGESNDEIEAETKLGDVGIFPRNGWVADYPVTPDVVGELRESIRAAADAGKIPQDEDEALKIFSDTVAQAGVAVVPYTGEGHQGKSTTAQSYPDPTVINNYYYDQGPPVVTYYAPPPDYYYLYSWVPYPFWYVGFWFPGYFILHDFHRTVFIGGRVHFVSNHFNDFRSHRVFRIDPVERFHGRTFAGIGVRNRRGFISTGSPTRDRAIFNHRTPGPGSAAPAFRDGRSFGGGRSQRFTAPRGGRSAAPGGSGGRTMGGRSGGRVGGGGGRVGGGGGGGRMGGGGRGR